MRIFITLALLLAAFSCVYSQTPPSSADRENARSMLNMIKSDVQKYYYDPQYHGMNLDERFKAANQKIDQAASLAQLLGIVDLKRRKEQKEVIAKSRGNEAFAGKIVVLIDSESGSAAELFARVVQLEKRGTVIGDRSAGAVMRSRVYSHTLGIDRLIPYAVSITDSDIIMTDGNSLEQVGVEPDELKLPAAADLATKRDPVLAYALSLVGVDYTPEKAGALFPLEWRK